MKKTKRTIITAAILTVAAAMAPDGSMEMSGSNIVPGTAEVTMRPIYGPPSVLNKKADIDMNGSVNIADYCLMLSAANGEGDSVQNDIADLNRDSKIDKLDIKSLQNYLFGKTGSIVPIFDEDEQMQPDYGCVDASQFCDD